MVLLAAHPILMKSDVICKHSRHDTRHNSSGNAGYGSGHNSVTPSVSPGHPGMLLCMSPNGDVDGMFHTMLMFDSNPSTFDDIDMDPTSNYNGLINSRHRGTDMRCRCRVNQLGLSTIATRIVT